MINNKYQVWPLVAFFILLCTALIFPLQDGDIFMYLAIARKSIQTGGIPLQDPFLYTFKDWHIYHEWLSYFIWYGSYVLGGFTGIIILNAGLWVAGFALLFRRFPLKKTASPIVLLILTLAAVACSHRFVAKSSLFSDLFSVFILGSLLQESPPWKKLRWLFPIFFLITINLHPGFMLGFVWLALYFVCQWKKPSIHQVQTYLFSLLACLVNPRGWRGVYYPIETVFKDEWKIYKDMNYEWLPTFASPFLQTWEVRALILLTVLTIVLWILQSWRDKANIFPRAATVLLIFLAAQASRFTATAALGLSLCALLAVNNSGWEWSEGKLKKLMSPIMGLLFLLAAGFILQRGYVGAAGLRTIGFGVDQKFMPVNAANFFKKQNLQGPIFNEFGWGSYLSWELGSELNISSPLFIHGHIDDPRILANDYFGVGRSKQAFDSTVERYGIRYFFLDVANLMTSPPPKLLSFLNDWEIVYHDKSAVILKKREVNWSSK